MAHPSIAEIHEAELVEQLVTRPILPLFGLVGMDPDAISITRVDMAGLPGDPQSDVDILRVNPAHPELAIAFQVKRIKVNARALVTGRPGKLRELRKAVRQTNQSVKVGFSQTYLYLFVVVDSRERNAGERTYAGMSAKEMSLLQQHFSVVAAGLDPRAGLCTGTWYSRWTTSL